MHHKIYMQNINTVIYKWPNTTKYYEYDMSFFTFNHVFTSQFLTEEISHMFLGARILVKDTKESPATTYVELKIMLEALWLLNTLYSVCNLLLKIPVNNFSAILASHCWLFKFNVDLKVFWICSILQFLLCLSAISENKLSQKNLWESRSQNLIAEKNKLGYSMEDWHLLPL